MKKKIQYENEPLQSDFCDDGYEFKTPVGGEFDPRWITAMGRRTATSVSDEKIVKRRRHTVGGTTYVVNSIFDTASNRSVEDNVKYLMKHENDKVS